MYAIGVMASLEPNTYAVGGDTVILPAEPRKPRDTFAPQIRYLYDKYPELSQAAISRRLGCSDKTVSRVLSEFLRGHTEDDLRQFQAQRADIYDAVQMRSLSSVTDDKLAKASALQLVTAAAILHDKAALCRGQATSITAVALLDVAQLMRQQMDGGE